MLEKITGHLTFGYYQVLSIGSSLGCASWGSMKKQKQEIITFKVPEALRDAMKGIPNRSEFIRHAVLAALDSICPLCRGAGVLLPHQKIHWEQFAMSHRLEECEACHAVHLVCARESQTLSIDTHEVGQSAQKIGKK